MDQTSTKPIRRFLHLSQNVASQVRDRADRWGLNESEAIHQLIHLGLRASAEGAHIVGGAQREQQEVLAVVSEVLSLQVKTLLYQRDAAACVLAMFSNSSEEVRDQKRNLLDGLDQRVNENARSALKKIKERLAREIDTSG